MRPGAIVLVVDDDVANREVYAACLAAAGLYVVEAANGVEALEVVAGTMPDIVVTDVAMPLMDGLRLCERLRADVRTKDLPVLVVTGDGDPTLPQRAMAAGCNDVLLKPVMPAVLLRAIARERRRRRREKVRP